MGTSGIQIATHKEYLSPWGGRPTQPVFATDSRALAPNVKTRRVGRIPVSTKQEIDLMCPGMAGREAEMQRLALAMAVIAIMLCGGSAIRAQAGTVF
jgi:hypothetical protein